MTIEISTAIAIIISVLSLGFSVFMGLKSNKRTDAKDIEERVKENTRINMKLDAISNNTTEIKNEVSEMRKEINSHDSRIIKVEESAKQAHHRLDTIEERLNTERSN
jgi:peptidoglycan hydrolase CwlO-like protein